VIVDMQPENLSLDGDEHPTPEKVRAMLQYLERREQSLTAHSIVEDLSAWGPWFAEQWLALLDQAAMPADFVEFVGDMRAALDDGYAERAPTDTRAYFHHWDASRHFMAGDPKYALKYKLDTAKSAADLFMGWLLLRRLAAKKPDDTPLAHKNE